MRSMLKPPTKLHDSFFKNFMGEPELAGRFLQEHLPSEVAELLAPETPELLPGSFVDEHLAQHHSDLLFRLRLKTGDPALAYLLLEHKSSPDKGTPLQLLRYIVRILAKCYDEHRRLPLPVVLPLVAHQGPGDWKFSTEFIDLFGSVPEALRPYLVSFRHALVDLPRIHDGALSADTRLGAYLKVLKYSRRRDLAEHLRMILVPELADMDIVRILHYINRGPTFVSGESVQAALRPLERSRGEKIMGHFSQEFEDRGRAIGEAKGLAEGRTKGLAEGRTKGLAEGRTKGLAEGRTKGLAEGRTKGRAEGEARALLRVLEKRFGAVSSRLRERLMTADVASIEAWLDRALDAHDLNSVFESSEIG
jgi:predicted transposase/invertase (TIGR01784 family)